MTVTPNEEYSLSPKYFSDANKDVNVLRLMNDGSTDVNRKEAWAKFDRFYSVDLTNELPSGRHYIFMCRPDLYLVDSSSSSSITLSKTSRVNVDPYFIYLEKWHPEIIASLTSDFSGIKRLNIPKANTSIITDKGNTRSLEMHSFIPYITSRVESLQLPDYTIEQNAIIQPYTKYTIPYSTNAIKSSSGQSFDLSFREDKYFSIHKLFYAWIYYQNNVMKNIFRPKTQYIQKNMLDYATSIYDFIVDDTGENIVYWAKYTGCIPTSVSMSELSFNRNSGAETKTSIPFSYFMCEHMDIHILMDFQYNSLGYTAMDSYFSKSKLCPFDYRTTTVPIYDSNTFLGNNFVGRPVIFHQTNNTNKPVFKLRWLPY